MPDYGKCSLCVSASLFCIRPLITDILNQLILISAIKFYQIGTKRIVQKVSGLYCNKSEFGI